MSWCCSSCWSVLASADCGADLNQRLKELYTASLPSADPAACCKSSSMRVSQHRGHPGGNLEVVGLIEALHVSVMEKHSKCEKPPWQGEERSGHQQSQHTPPWPRQPCCSHWACPLPGGCSLCAPGSWLLVLPKSQKIKLACSK